MATGPTAVPSYIIGSEPNVHFTPIVTSGESLPSGAIFAGIPDGLGAFDNGDGTFTVLVNHEISSGGLVQDHGGTGAYIDVLTIDSSTLQIVADHDAIQHVFLWNGTGYVETAGVSFSRFCSGDLPATSALYNSATGAGTQQHIYLTGEENGFEGKATATIVDGVGAGNTYELGYLGNMAYENIVANPTEQQKTVVALTDDGTNGQVYIYVGEKSTSGDVIQQAGLSGGSFYGIQVAGLDSNNEQQATAANGSFSLVAVNGGDVSALNGATIDSMSETAGVTTFLRPEDFSWDPQNPSVAYFATTNSFTGISRIYQLTFADIAHPELGGTIQAVVESDDYGAHMFDNLTVSDGKVIVQEDPGGNDYVARLGI
jgi:secreted PhoX family phosphatase